MDPKDCLAIVDGTLHAEGLGAPVTIVRDCWGIPHVRAQSSHDAFFGQGYCMAQDRLWQIELIREMAYGRAAALLNRGLLGLDQQNRTLGFARLAADEWKRQSPRARSALAGYAAGINAAIATQPRPFEFEQLGHTMAPWSPVDSLAIIKLVSNGMQWATKLKLGQVSAALGPAAANALLPVVPEGANLIVPSGLRWAGRPHPFELDVARAMGEPDGVVAAGGGSNCWVIDGSKTASGSPLVAGDPHLPMSLPAQWYVVHMECPEFTAAGPCNPGYPGPVFYGHNTKVAWTMTHAQGDRWDLYRERVRRGADGPEYLYRGEWHAFQSRTEHYEVRGGDATTATVWSTRHGPVVFGDPENDDEVIAARWGLADACHDMDATLDVLHASTAAEARAGFRGYDSVSGNFCFADRAGDIGYQYAGRLPKHDPVLVPVPGWTGEHEWAGYIPKGELPAQENPECGYFITANNRTTTPDYPHYLSYMAYRFRADRLHELIDGQERFDREDMRRIQGDVTSVAARALAAIFAAAPVAAGLPEQVRALFATWDSMLSPDSAAALAFDAVCEVLTERTLRAFLARAAVKVSVTPTEERRILIDQIQGGEMIMLPAGMTWDALIGEAIASASAALAETFGDDPQTWRWDSRHEMRWRHNLGRQPELADALNLAPVGIGGDGTTVFATTPDHDKSVMAGVSYRQIFDLSDLNAAQICIPPGNSGQPGSPHYADNVERWCDVEYHPLFIDWADIDANAEARLELVP